jgi:hypothetical protein
VNFYWTLLFHTSGAANKLVPVKKGTKQKNYKEQNKKKKN